KRRPSSVCSGISLPPSTLPKPCAKSSVNHCPAMPPIKTFGERIADALVEDGLLFRKQVDELMELQKREGTRLLKIIIDKAYVTEQDMAVSMGRVLNTPPVNLARLGIAPEVADLLPRDICQSHKVLP